jgi:hypothetical protein
MRHCGRALPKTDELAPLIFVIAEKLCRGILSLRFRQEVQKVLRKHRAAADAALNRRIVAFGWWGFSAVPIFRHC